MPPPRRKKPVRAPQNKPKPAPQAAIDEGTLPEPVRDFFRRPDYKKDVRAWNRVYEAYLNYLWGPDSTNVRVTEEEPQLYAQWLTEPAIYNRNNKRKHVREYIEKMVHVVRNADLKNRPLRSKWRKLSVPEREELFLSSIAFITEGFHEETQTRNEAPEIQLEAMTAGDGEGFIRLVDFFVDNYDRSLTEGTDSFVPLEHAVWDRVYKRDRPEEEVLLPKPVRAFVEEMLLDRHLFIVFFLSKDGIVVEGVRLKNAAGSKLSPDALATIDVDGTMDPSELNSRINDLRISESGTEEACTGCSLPKRRIPKLEGKDFSYCSKCRKFGRKVPFCSQECMTTAWPEHKKSCGKTLSSIETIPTYSTPTPRTCCDHDHDHHSHVPKTAPPREITMDYMQDIKKAKREPPTPSLLRQLKDFTPDEVWHVYYTSPATGQPAKRAITFKENAHAYKTFMSIRQIAFEVRDPRACGLLCAVMLEGAVDDYVGGEVSEEMVAQQMKVDFGWTEEQLEGLVPPGHILVDLDMVPDLPELVVKAGTKQVELD
ncbi:hypothetical protein JCM1840_004617 [Sporobolomyces johnsonii]